MEAEGGVAITGRGMISSLGSNVTTACAAERAGLSGASDLDLVLKSLDDGEPTPVRGCAAGSLTRGFEGFARLLRLAHLGLADLLRQDPNGPWLSHQTCVYLALPDPQRIWTGTALIPDDEARSRREEDAKEALEDPPPNIASRLLQTATRLAGWPVDPTLRFSSTEGHTGVAEALDRAMSDLQDGRVGAAIVGGVDSLLDESTLVWLDGAHRLKRDGVPVGLVPGEAGAFLLLETQKAAKARGARVYGTVRKVVSAHDKTPHIEGANPLGEGLAEVLRGVAPVAKLAEPAPAWIVHDMNGETYRAMEWGMALARVRAELPSLASPVIWYPAISFGDVGAATGALAISVVTHAFARRRAPSGRALVISSSDGPARRAFVVAATPS